MLNFVDYYIQYTERVSDLNNAVQKSPEMLVKQMEYQYRKRLDEIADFLYYGTGAEGNKLLLLSGPSSSGKTTTARMLCERFEWLGIKARKISMDDFFLGRENTPLLPDGSPDFESVAALNIPQLTECLLNLIKNGECDKPRFDFVNQRPLPELEHVRLGKDDIVVVEGIHALNPIVTECLPEESTLKAYVSVKQGIYEGDREIMTAHEVRFCRRMVRDMLFRGTSPEKTFEQWPKVLEGEEKYIQPFKRLADVTINSIHIYEPCLIRQIALPLLERIGIESPYFEQTLDMKTKLRMFSPLSSEYIPANSLMREFIGNGIYCE